MTVAKWGGFCDLHAERCWLFCVLKGVMLSQKWKHTVCVCKRMPNELKSACAEPDKDQLGWSATIYRACLKTLCMFLSFTRRNEYLLSGFNREGWTVLLKLYSFSSRFKYYPTDNFSVNNIYLCIDCYIIQRGLFMNWNLITDTSQTHFNQSIDIDIILFLSFVLHFRDAWENMQWMCLDPYSRLSLRQETTLSSLLSPHLAISAQCSQIWDNRHIISNKYMWIPH